MWVRIKLTISQNCLMLKQFNLLEFSTVFSGSGDPLATLIFWVVETLLQHLFLGSGYPLATFNLFLVIWVV